MKKAIKVFCVLFILCFVFTTLSFAQDEKEGFIKRMWKKATGKTEEEVETSKPKQETLKEEAMKIVPKTPPAREDAPQGPPPAFERKDMIRQLKDYLSTWRGELTSVMPQIVEKTDRDGKVEYLFKNNAGEEMPFEDLPDEVLSNLLVKVSSEISRIQNERLQRQIQQIQQQQQQVQQQQQIIQQQQRVQQNQPPRLPQLPQMPQRPPQVHQPPRPPSIPGPPPGPPAGAPR